MGEFNSDDHYIYYCGQESLRRNGVVIMVNKRVWNAVLGCSLTVVQVYALTSNAEEAEVEWFYEDLQDLLELTPQKRCPFIIGSWNAKVGSQETPGVTGKFGLVVQSEAGQRLIEFFKRTHWSQQTPSSNSIREEFTHEHHQIINTEIRLIISFAVKDGKALYSQQK